MEKNTAQTETAPTIEGPYWDYTHAARYAKQQRDIYARIIADYVCSGDIKRAKLFKANYEGFKAMHERITDRYDTTKDNEEITWIGWH